MNEENLRLIDVENENTNIRSIEEKSFYELPIQKNENTKISEGNKGNNQVISKLPTWSIEPPLEIKR